MRHLLFLTPFLLFMACQPETTEHTAQVASDTLTGEQHRPRYHFTPPEQWMNDPNGMVYYDGEYHLFYQHYPDSNVWGPMHWGHAVSEDLVHWEHLPIALYPDSLGMIFSGSAVADLENTSGFGTAEDSPLIAIFTYHDAEAAEAGANDHQTQGIAFSTDRGRSWEKYEGNPVVENPGIKDFRDPKVFWYAPDQKWVMIFAAADRVRIYNSPDLKNWEFQSEFGENSGDHGGVWECPDLFPLMVNGEEKWVMLLSINPGGPNGGSATQYFVGDFDGETFANDNPEETTLWVDYGKDNYAGVSWSNVPENDGRRIFLGWMSNWQYANVVPTYSWRSAMTVARKLELADTPEGIRLISLPVEELHQLRADSYSLEPRSIPNELSLTEFTEWQTPAKEVMLEFVIPEGAEGLDFGIVISNSLGEEVRIGYDQAQQQYYFDRTKAGKMDFSEDFAGRFPAPRIAGSDTIKMHLYVDVASAELFADDGKTVMTNIFFPNENFQQLGLYSENGEVQLVSGTLYNLSPATIAME
ncbi:fructan beta-fructosidase [Catalinimonas alkaloidigena]|uniref:glycoside hydrolase family 32 protein n=1 Tax=Catalinimonas alkaloidigena TaxID=1075417 RepID=UPI002406F48E|nr:glycoside hydrolase family 32 protein [Catalinimonas alkaloidigena]MDF9800176.1 fructan beta-fructosidase [Catalinimonas alkaloidigena]